MGESAWKHISACGTTGRIKVSYDGALHGTQSYIPEFCRAGKCMMSHSDHGFVPIKWQEAYYSILVDRMWPSPLQCKPEQSNQNNNIHFAIGHMPHLNCSLVPRPHWRRESPRPRGRKVFLSSHAAWERG